MHSCLVEAAVVAAVVAIVAAKRKGNMYIYRSHERPFHRLDFRVCVCTLYTVHCTPYTVRTIELRIPTHTLHMRSRFTPQDEKISFTENMFDPRSEFRARTTRLPRLFRLLARLNCALPIFSLGNSTNLSIRVLNFYTVSISETSSTTRTTVAKVLSNATGRE